jgi:hypothetical protein
MACLQLSELGQVDLAAYHLTVDHRTSPMGYWICISWDLMGMIFMFALAGFSLTR